MVVLDITSDGCLGQLTCILKANHMAQTEAEVARKTDTIMAQADKDGDGVVTFDGTWKQKHLLFFRVRVRVRGREGGFELIRTSNSHIIFRF